MEQNMEEVYRQYAQQVYRYLFSLCHDEALAEELTQEAFYQAVRSVKRYDASCKISVWLCQIGKHLWFQELRKRKRRKQYETESEQELQQQPDLSANVEAAAETSEEARALFRAIHKLEEPMREVIYLRLTGNFTFREIGELMERDENWARVTFYRGKQKLRQRRKEQDEM